MEKNMNGNKKSRIYVNNINNKTTNNKTLNNEQVTYIRDPNDTRIDSSTTRIGRTSSASPEVPMWDEYYKTGAKKLAIAEKIFHIECSLTAKKKNGRRALNLDIFLEPHTKPLKYISHMVPYNRKYEVFANLTPQQLKWNKWDTIREYYSDYKELDVQYGKCQHRVRNTRYLSRNTVPHCVAGIFRQDSKFYANILLFDKEYIIELTDQIDTNKGAHMHYVARGSMRTAWDEPEELDLDL